MQNLNDLELWRQRREDLLREAAVRRLARSGRGTRPASALGWELRRFGGLLLKRLRRKSG